MSLIENRTWKITCKRGFVTQCLDEVVIQANEEIRSTAAAEKELRNQGWTLHEDGEGTCPVCLKLWDGELVLETKGSIKTTEVDGGGGTRKDVPTEAPAKIGGDPVNSGTEDARPEVERL